MQATAILRASGGASRRAIVGNAPSEPSDGDALEAGRQATTARPRPGGNNGYARSGRLR